MVDWWAVGVIAFEFMIGGLPFNAKTKEEVFENIKSHRIKWPDDEILSQINPDLIDLIKQLLNPLPSKRLGYKGAKEVMSHPFFKDIDWQNTKMMEPPFVPDIKKRIDLSWFDKNKQFDLIDIE